MRSPQRLAQAAPHQVVEAGQERRRASCRARGRGDQHVLARGDPQASRRAAARWGAEALAEPARDQRMQRIEDVGHAGPQGSPTEQMLRGSSTAIRPAALGRDRPSRRSLTGASILEGAKRWLGPGPLQQAVACRYSSGQVVRQPSGRGLWATRPRSSRLLAGRCADARFVERAIVDPHQQPIPPMKRIDHLGHGEVDAGLELGADRRADGVRHRDRRRGPALGQVAADVDGAVRPPRSAARDATTAARARRWRLRCLARGRPARSGSERWSWSRIMYCPGGRTARRRRASAASAGKIRRSDRERADRARPTRGPAGRRGPQRHRLPWSVLPRASRPPRPRGWRCAS